MELASDAEPTFRQLVSQSMENFSQKRAERLQHGLGGALLVHGKAQSHSGCISIQLQVSMTYLNVLPAVALMVKNHRGNQAEALQCMSPLHMSPAHGSREAADCVHGQLLFWSALQMLQEPRLDQSLTSLHASIF